MMISADSFLTKQQFKQCIKIYNQCTAANTSPAAQITKEIILPNLGAIEIKLKQQCDPRYLGYVVEYFILRERHRPDGYK